MQRAQYAQAMAILSNPMVPEEAKMQYRVMLMSQGVDPALLFAEEEESETEQISATKFMTPVHYHPLTRIMSLKELRRKDRDYVGTGAQCNTCGSLNRFPIYHCNPCNFDVCSSCFGEDPALHRVPYHRHTLIELQDRGELYECDRDYLGSDFVCSVCDDVGQYPVLHCAECNYDICRHCTKRVNALHRCGLHHHGLLKCSNPRELASLDGGYSGGSGFVCDNCGVGDNYPVYHCNQCSYDACNDCFMAATGAAPPATFECRAHGHKMRRYLTLKELQNRDPDYKGVNVVVCDECSKASNEPGGIFPLYHCNYDNTNICYPCFAKTGGQDDSLLKTEFHKHTLTLIETAHDLSHQDRDYADGQYVCNLCQNQGFFPVAHCSDCNFDICPQCTKRASTIWKSPKHVHGLVKVMAPHELRAMDPDYASGSYRCKSCNIVDFYPMFHCNEHNFDLCENCYVLSNMPPAPPQPAVVTPPAPVLASAGIPAMYTPPPVTYVPAPAPVYMPAPPAAAAAPLPPPPVEAEPPVDYEALQRKAREMLLPPQPLVPNFTNPTPLTRLPASGPFQKRGVSNTDLRDRNYTITADGSLKYQQLDGLKTLLMGPDRGSFSLATATFQIPLLWQFMDLPNKANVMKKEGAAKADIEKELLSMSSDSDYIAQQIDVDQGLNLVTAERTYFFRFGSKRDRDEFVKVLLSHGVKHAPYCADADARSLRAAMRGLGTNDKLLIGIIGHRNNAQLQAVRVEFDKMFGRSLAKDIQDETSGKYERVLLGLLQPASDFDAHCIHKAIAGLGTDERALIDVLCTRYSFEIPEIRKSYDMQFNQSMERDIKGDTSGWFESLLIKLARGERNEVEDWTEAEIDEDCQKLYKAGEGCWGTDEKKFVKIMTKRGSKYVSLLSQRYSRYHKATLADAIKSEFSGHIKETLVALCQDPIDTLADSVHRAVKGFGTDDDRLIRILVSTKNRGLMPKLREAYERKYSSLPKTVESETSGDYKKILLAIVDDF